MIEQSIVMGATRYEDTPDGSTGLGVGRDCHIRRAIIDKNVQIPEGMRIGYDADEDRKNGLTVTENGVVAVPKDARFDTHSNVLKPHIR